MNNTLRSWYDWLIKVMILAVAYWIAGKLGLLLAIPPGYATAVWPPSGIALAALLLYGFQLWPGILIGSFLINVGTSFNDSSLLTIVKSLGLAVDIGMGATLQALCGAWLIRKYVRYPYYLFKVKDIARFMTLGGPISCLISATVGVGSLWWTQRIQPNGVLYNWWTWWVGDTLGVITVGTLIIIILTTPQSGWLNRQLTVSMPIVVSYIIVIKLFIFASHREIDRQQKELYQQSEILTKLIKNRFDFLFEGLTVLKSFFYTFDVINRDVFHNVTENLIRIRPELKAISWNPLIRNIDRVEFEMNMCQEGFKDFHITELDEHNQLTLTTPRSEYYPVLYMVPASDNQLVVGYDLASEMDQQKAITRALAAKSMAATGRIKLKPISYNQSIILFFLPVFDPDTVNESGNESQASPKGMLVAFMDIKRLIDNVMKDQIIENFNLSIHDTMAAKGNAVLYSGRVSPTTESDNVGDKPTANGLHAWHETIEIGGRQWEIKFSPSPNYHTQNRTLSLQAFGILAWGLIFASSFGVLLLITTGQTANVEEQVNRRTVELSLANHEKEVMLREIHHRVKNNFQVIASLLRLQADELTSEMAVIQLQECQNRIQAMALIHENLYHDETLSHIDFSAYIRKLSSILLSFYGSRADKIHLKMDLEQIFFPWSRLRHAG